MLLDGARILVTGVLDPRSIAFAIAREAQEQGAEVLLTGFGRGRRLTERSAQRLPRPPEVLELDVTRPEDLASVADDLGGRWGALDGLVHAIAFAPPSCLGGGFSAAPWADVQTALQVSTWSLATLTHALTDLLEKGRAPSVVGLDFDAGQVWPGYDWMGVAKAGLEACARYLAHELGPRGVRVNLVAAGPLHTLAAHGIEGFGELEASWAARAPLGWDPKDPTPVAKAALALLSDLTIGVTGELLHVDGGAHAVGAGRPPAG